MVGKSVPGVGGERKGFGIWKGARVRGREDRIRVE